MGGGGSLKPVECRVQLTATTILKRSYSSAYRTVSDNMPGRPQARVSAGVRSRIHLRKRRFGIFAERLSFVRPNFWLCPWPLRPHRAQPTPSAQPGKQKKIALRKSIRPGSSLSRSSRQASSAICRTLILRSWYAPSRHRATEQRF
jgi:hypothetical protein